MVFQDFFMWFIQDYAVLSVPIMLLTLRYTTKEK